MRVCLATDLTLGRPVICHALDERTFLSALPAILRGLAEGVITSADCTSPDGRFRIRRR
jgi:hypothetical protein